MPTDRSGRAPAPTRGLLVGGVVVVAAGLATTSWALWPRDGAPVRLPTASVTAVDQSAVDPTAYAHELRSAADDARAAQGLPRFTVADCAAPVALARATALVGKPLVHAPLDPVRAACPSADITAENLSRAEAAPADVVTAWMASAGHRANLLDPTLTAMVVACTHDGTQMLCSQLFTGTSGSPTP